MSSAQKKKLRRRFLLFQQKEVKEKERSYSREATIKKCCRSIHPVPSLAGRKTFDVDAKRRFNSSYLAVYNL